MNKFTPKDKLSKKARKALNTQRRTLWDVSPVTKTVESKKRYSRKRKQYLNRDDFGAASFLRVTYSQWGQCSSTWSSFSS